METAGQLLVTAASSAVAAAQNDARDARAQFQHNAHVVHDQFIGLLPWIKHAVYVASVVIFLGISSFLTYGLFYAAVMPSNLAVKPLYFDYSARVPSMPPSVGDDPGDAGSCMQQACSKEVPVPQGPVATVDLFAKHTPCQAFQSDILPPPVTKNRLLQSGKAYFVEIALLLPETETNRHLGMFTVSVDLKSTDAVLATSVRSARFPYESNWLGVVRKLFMLLPLLLGAVEESRTVTMTPFTHFVESEKHPLQHMVVRLDMPYKPPNGVHHVEVVSGEVRVAKELNQFQNVLKNWFFTCYIIGALMIFGVKVVIWLTLEVVWDQSRERLSRQRAQSPDGLSNQEFEQWEGMTQEQIDDNNDWEDMPLQEDVDETQPAPDNPDSVAAHAMPVSAAEGTNETGDEHDGMGGAISSSSAQEDATKGRTSQDEKIIPKEELSL